MLQGFRDADAVSQILEQANAFAEQGPRLGDVPRSDRHPAKLVERVGDAPAVPQAPVEREGLLMLTLRRDGISQIKRDCSKGVQSVCLPRFVPELALDRE